MNQTMEIILGFLSLLMAVAAGCWIACRALKRSEDPVRLVVKWAVTVVLAIPVLFFAAGAKDPMSKFFAIMGGAIVGLVYAAIWVPSLCAIVAKPFTNLYDGGDQEVIPQAFYSIAEAKRKRGKYLEAVAEIRKQLARFPGDYTGEMMLAEIQAEQLDDLPGAQTTIEKILINPELPSRNGALALNRLADWHLRFGHDPDSARVALQRIGELFPETEQAYLATQRIAHLTTPDLLDEKREPHRIKLRKFDENLGLLDGPSSVQPPTDDPATAASKLVQHLEQRPQDNEAREKLAVIYAEHYQRLDLATGQVEELLAQPNVPAKMAVHWLNLLADLHIKCAGDLDGARQALQRIGDLFPQSASAETAKNRMAYLTLELRSKKASQVVKLGSYEQNLGLKREP